MNQTECLAYCKTYAAAGFPDDKATARNVLEHIVPSARHAINSIEDSNAVLAASKWARGMLST